MRATGVWRCDRYSKGVILLGFYGYGIVLLSRLFLYSLLVYEWYLAKMPGKFSMCHLGECRAYVSAREDQWQGNKQHVLTRIII